MFTGTAKSNVVFSTRLKLSLLTLLFMVLSSCSIGVKLPEVDLSAPGWTVWQGQALWKADAERPAIAGDIIIARHTTGDVLVSFAKPPVPIFTAQTAGKKWKLDLIHRQRAYAGRGGPPARFVWFQIPALLQDKTTPEGWQLLVKQDSVWELQNSDSGEQIRLVLD